MTDTPFTDKHASPWVPEPNTDWVPAYMVRELERLLVQVCKRPADYPLILDVREKYEKLIK